MKLKQCKSIMKYDWLILMMTNFPHKLLLTSRQVANLRKTFANNSSVNIKLLKIQLSKMIQSGGFLGGLLGPLLKKGLPLGITAAAAANARIHKGMNLRIQNNNTNNIK